MDWPFLPAVYIDHDDDFRKLIDQLAQEPLIAFDTESNSLHAYKERVCLIQISTWTADYIVDPLRVADLSPLGGILSNPAIEKVFHAAEYDLMCLKRDYGFTLVNLFDTMIAARIVGFKAIGLNKLLAEYCGIDADKSHQRDDWGQRPLSEEGLLYAQMDTHFLPQLRDILWAKLEEKGSLDEALETFTEACNVPAAHNEFDPDGYWRIGIPNDLTRRQIAILRELYLLQIRRYGRQLLNAIDRGKRAPLPHPPARHPDIAPAVAERFTALRDWRKQRAEERGVESDVIISKDALWTLAQREPVTLDDLNDIEGLGPWRLATYGQALLDVIRQLRNGTGE
jgi:ribonuclease D